MDKEQETTDLNADGHENVRLQLARMMIKSGHPVKSNEGMRILLTAAYGYEPTPEDEILLAVARARFQQQLEEKRNDDNQTATPVS